MIEESIFTELSGVSGLIGGGIWPDTAPPRVERPFCVYQQISGTAINTLCGSARHNARVQFWVWSETRAEANALMRDIADALAGASSFKAVPIGELTAQHDDATNLYGAQQDFSIWYRE